MPIASRFSAAGISGCGSFNREGSTLPFASDSEMDAGHAGQDSADRAGHSAEGKDGVLAAVTSLRMRHAWIRIHGREDIHQRGDNENRNPHLRRQDHGCVNGLHLSRLCDQLHRQFTLFINRHGDDTRRASRAGSYSASTLWTS